MADTPSSSAPSQIEPPSAPGKTLPDAARRALEEAEGRRAAWITSQAAEKPGEIGGPAGPEPTRFGDWERKGMAVDF